MSEVRMMPPRLLKTQVSKIQWTTALVHPHYGGVRCLAYRQESGNGTIGPVRLFDSAQREMILPYQVLHALEHLIPKGSRVAVDGELYVRDAPPAQIEDACFRQTAVTSELVYHTYDSVSAEDYAARTTDLYALHARSHVSRYLVYTEPVKVRSKDELLHCQQHFLGKGYAGAMLRSGPYGYIQGKLSLGFLLCAPFKQDAFEIVDWKPIGGGNPWCIPEFICCTKFGDDFSVKGPRMLPVPPVDPGQYIGQKLRVAYAHLTHDGAPVPYLPVALSNPYAGG